jgi:hypothetical protein
MSAAATISAVAIPASLRKRRRTRAKWRDSDTREQSFHRQLFHGICPVMSARALAAPKSHIPLKVDWLRSGKTQAAARAWTAKEYSASRCEACESFVAQHRKWQRCAEFNPWRCAPALLRWHQDLIAHHDDAVALDGVVGQDFGGVAAGVHDDDVVRSVLGEGQRLAIDRFQFRLVAASLDGQVELAGVMTSYSQPCGLTALAALNNSRNIWNSAVPNWRNTAVAPRSGLLG